MAGFFYKSLKDLKGFLYLPFRFRNLVSETLIPEQFGFGVWFLLKTPVRKKLIYLI